MVTTGYCPEDEAVWVTVEGQSFFRTRDLVQLLDGGDGRFIYHGRKDRATKWHGQWLDLAQLEKRIQDLEGVREACLVEHGAELHVFGVLQCSHRAAELPRQMQTLQTLRQLLPWPCAVHLRQRLPRSAAGKMDVQALEASLTSCGAATAKEADAQRFGQTCRRHLGLMLGALLLTLNGEALVHWMVRRRGRIQWLRPLSLAFAWLALAYGDSAERPGPFSRLGVLLVLHALPGTAMRQLRWALALGGLLLARREGRAASWPLVFWCGIGTSLDFELTSAFRHGMLYGLLRHARWSADWLNEAIHQLLSRATPPFAFRLSLLRRQRRRWGTTSRSTSCQWEEYPKSERDQLYYDQWIAQSLEKAEAPAAPAPGLPGPRRAPPAPTSDDAIAVTFSRGAVDWALQVLAPSASASASSSAVPALNARAERVLNVLEQAVPGLDPDASLIGLDSLKASFLSSALHKRCGLRLSGQQVRQASSLRALADLATAVPMPPARRERTPEKAEEYRIWFTPGQYQPMSPWLTRSNRFARPDAALLQRATAALQQRHPALRATCEGPMALRAFVLTVSVLLCAADEVGLFGPLAQLRRVLGRALLRVWPKVKVPSAKTPEQRPVATNALDVGYAPRSKALDLSAPFDVVDLYGGQQELEKKMHSRTMCPPFEVILLQLHLPIEGVWDCEGGHISIFREGEDLVYVDPIRWRSAKLHPASSAWLLQGRLQQDGEVFLRFPTPEELQGCFCLRPQGTWHRFHASRIAQRHDSLETFSFVMIQCYHAFGDGYCYSPLASDLFEAYEAVTSQEKADQLMQPGPRDGTGEALAVLQRRLEETLLAGPDPSRASLRGNLWSAWFNGYSSHLSIEGETLAVLKAIAGRYSIPMNYLLLAIVIAAKARASHEMEVDLTLYVPMRDGMEAGMVGLFADWRDVSVAAPWDGTVLQLLLEVYDVLRLRRWKVFNPLRKAERTVVNFDLRDPRALSTAGFVQVPEAFWRSPYRANWNQWEWLHQPLQFDVVEEHSERWCIHARMSYQHYPPQWRRRWIQGIQDATYDAVFQPWQQVHKPFE
ncbi:unnamed protein product [Durusdinium trenchii]